MRKNKREGTTNDVFFFGFTLMFFVLNRFFISRNFVWNRGDSNNFLIKNSDKSWTPHDFFVVMHYLYIINEIAKLVEINMITCMDWISCAHYTFFSFLIFFYLNKRIKTEYLRWKIKYFSCFDYDVDFTLLVSYEKLVWLNDQWFQSILKCSSIL